MRFYLTFQNIVITRNIDVIPLTYSKKYNKNVPMFSERLTPNFAVSA